MIKMIITFISLFVIFYVGIDLFRKFTKKEKIGVMFTAAYSALVAALVIIILTGIVIIF